MSPSPWGHTGSSMLEAARVSPEKPRAEARAWGTPPCARKPLTAGHLHLHDLCPDSLHSSLDWGTPSPPATASLLLNPPPTRVLTP